MENLFFTGICISPRFRASARTSVVGFNSGQRVDDHFVEVTEMVEIGSGAKRPVRAVMMSRYRGAWPSLAFATFVMVVTAGCSILRATVSA